MLELETVDEQFKIPFEIIENGSGIFHGVVDDIDQSEGPSFVFTTLRRILRVDPYLPIEPKMVIKGLGNSVFIVAHNGFSETEEGPLFNTFKLFECLKQYSWQTRGDTIDTVTGLKKTSGLSVSTNIWGVYEPERESFDRETKVPIEVVRFITNRPISKSDVVDGRDVIRVDEMLGIYIATLR